MGNLIIEGTTLKWGTRRTPKNIPEKTILTRDMMQNWKFFDGDGLNVSNLHGLSIASMKPKYTEVWKSKLRCYCSGKSTTYDQWCGVTNAVWYQLECIGSKLPIGTKMGDETVKNVKNGNALRFPISENKTQNITRKKAAPSNTDIVPK